MMKNNLPLTFKNYPEFIDSLLLADDYIERDVAYNFDIKENSFIALYINNSKKEKTIFTVKEIIQIRGLIIESIKYSDIKSFHVSASTANTKLSYDELKRTADSLIIESKRGEKIRFFFDGTKGNERNIRDPFGISQLMKILISRYT